MSQQLRLLDVPVSAPRLRPATIALGKHWVAECRKVLAAAVDTSPTPEYRQYRPTNRKAPRNV